MWILYDSIFLIIALVYLPVYLFRRKFHVGFKMRFGVLPSGLKLNRPIWIHAVSVGEVMAVKNLIGELRAAYPEKHFFISTVTPTGNKIARSIAKENDFVAYFPLDLSFIVRRVVDRIQPSLFIVTETEIWPNLILCLYQKKIPIVLVNGRISDRSFKGYLNIKFLLKPILNRINLFCVQTKRDAERLFRLGVAEDRILITGNMKFDNTASLDKKVSDSADKYRGLLGMNPEDKLWVCGSTHPGEEEIILDVYKKLLSDFPLTKLLIAPRHPERAGQIEKAAAKSGFRSTFVSALPGKPCNCISKCVFILDVIGELVYFYNIANIVFVGGSLIKKGGQNILEPASLGKPVITGPYMFNFHDIARLFQENKACLLGHNKEDLLAGIKDLLRNPDKCIQLGQRAKEIILQNQGATAKNLECISNYLSKEEGGIK